MGPVDLRARISAELNAIDDSVRRAATARARYELEHDDIFLDSVALNMQAVCTGMERTLTYLIEHIDGAVPTGGDWHASLVRLAATESPDTRPAIISAETDGLLTELRGFRHVSRHLYPSLYDAERLCALSANLHRLAGLFRRDIDAFMQLLP